MFEFLKKLPLFSGLSQADLDQICQMAEDVRLPAGEELFAEGSHGDRAYIIQEGQIEIVKHSGGREVLLAVRSTGDVIGEMSLLEAAPRNASARARTDSILIAISHAQLNQLLDSSPSAARSLLTTITSRLKATELMLRQSEKMAQLGTLTAGITHELNNPAAAAQRGAQQLFSAVESLQAALMEINKEDLPPGQQESLQKLERLAQERAARPPHLNPLERSDQEYEVEAWLEKHHLQDQWECAPALVILGLGPHELDSLSQAFLGGKTAVIISWLCSTYTVYALLEEIRQGATQISNIVRSLKSYVYLDQGPVQTVDIHEGLENTLIMLRNKLKSGIAVRREYSSLIPLIQAYGSELNQVWTNLIDNAIDAMQGNGELVLRTNREDDWVVVEIQDSGSGIPEDIQSKVFSPFFTTKPVGQGTGLGLNISYNIILKHKGEIKVFSQPGRTCFEVWLPIHPDPDQSKTPEAAYQPPGDEDLRRILASTKTIAVVGISDHPERPAHSVPAYLQAQGYRIVPVNPTIQNVLGEKAYPDLASIPEPVDAVLIFRRSETVLPIVEEAIQIKAKVVWMQEGIVNEAAADVARQAGLDVVMDQCMRAQHIRLIKTSH